MDLNSIGINYGTVDGSLYGKTRSRRVVKQKEEAEKEQLKPKDKGTSVAGSGKGRVVDVSM